MDFIEVLTLYNRAVSSNDLVTQEALNPVITEAKRMAGRRGRKCSVSDEEVAEAIGNEIGKMERQMALAGPTHRELREKYGKRKKLLEQLLTEQESE